MSTVTIYRIERTKTYQMAEQGTGFSLRPWGANTAYYEGSDDGGQEYVLPDGYEVAMSNGGTEEIYDRNGRCCEIFTHSSGRPQLISAGEEQPVLTLANS